MAVEGNGLINSRVSVSHDQGFTLIELMITVVVLAILATLAAPALNQIEQRRVIGAGSSALDFVQTARTEAIKQGRNMFFVTQEDGEDWCFGISSTRASSESVCDCRVQDATETAACTIVLAGTETPAVFAVQGGDFRNIIMQGEQTLEFSYVRGTLAAGSDRENVIFQSSPRDFRMQLEVNEIGRPRLCGPNRAMGAYPVC